MSYGRRPELLSRHGGVKMLVNVTGAEFLRRVAVGTGAVLRAKVVKVIRVADFGVVGVQTPHLIDNRVVVPVEHPAAAVAVVRMIVFVHFIRRQIIEFK